MSNILHVDFLEGVKKEEFNLALISHFSTDSGGQPWMNQFDLVIDSSFYHFWDYVRTKYSVDSRELIPKPIRAKVEQKTRGIDSKGYPWVNSLSVSDEIQTEVTIFYPHTCGLLDEVEAEEYREYVKAITRLDEFNNL